MANIIDYVNWRGDLTFENDPLNAVDNLILTRLTYIEFDDLKDGCEEFESVSKRYLASDEKLDLGLVLTGDSKPLLEACGTSNRFKHLKVRNFVNVIDESVEIQFSAVTFELNKREAFISFRGTDDTIVGWKEDFNMTFLDVVPAQTKALAYLENIMKKNRYRKVYVGGHSKGGNLAVYAAINLDKRLKKRIEVVYNNDGPGFKESLIQRDEYKSIQDRIQTLVPQSSVVGLLLEHEEEYKVIQSSKSGIMQHDGFGWDVIGNDFIYLDELDAEGKMVDLTTKRSLELLKPEQRQAFGNVLFDLLAATESKTLTELGKNGLESLSAITKSYYALDDETRKLFDDTISLFIDESYKSFLEVTELDQWKEKLKEWSDEKKVGIESFFKGLSEKQNDN